MCFWPQRRAIFRHQNFKMCSENVVFCAFSLQNVLFATAACNFWFLLWPHDSAPAALTGLLFDWTDTRIIEKTQHFATSLTFGADVFSFFWLSRYCICFLLTWLLYSAFQLSILSEVWLLNFLRLQPFQSLGTRTIAGNTSIHLEKVESPFQLCITRNIVQSSSNREWGPNPSVATRSVDLQLNLVNSKPTSAFSYTIVTIQSGKSPTQ